MNDNKDLEDIVTELGENKFTFLDTIENKINSHVSNRSTPDCLSFVEKDEYGVIKRVWKLEASIDYIKCLTNFCSESKFNGNSLDSYLTDDIVKIVTTEFEQFYIKNTDDITPILANILIQDQVFLSSLTEQIIEYTNSEIPSSLKRQVSGILLDKLDDVFNTNISHSTAHAINLAATKSITLAVSTPLGSQIALIIIHYLAVHLKVVLAKLLASTGIKTMITIAVKKFVVMGLIVSLMKLVGAKLSLSAGATFAFVLIPILAAFITYEAIYLPKKLGVKVSEKVRAELSGNFEKINKSILQEAMSQILKSEIGTLASSIGQEPEFQSALDELIKQLKN